MGHAVTRRWTRSGCHVESTHPQLGSIPRGRVEPVRAAEGAGAYMTWRLIDADWTEHDLWIAADYLTAEQILLHLTAWAEEPAGPNDFEESADVDR